MNANESLSSLPPRDDHDVETIRREPITITYFDLESEQAALVAAARRTLRDYEPCSLLDVKGRPPASVARELFLPSSVQCLQGIGRVGLRFFVASHDMAALDGTVYPMPLHAGISYNYNKGGKNIRVIGSPVASLLHMTKEIEGLSSEDRELMIKHYFGIFIESLSGSEVIVLGIPSKGGYPAEESPTYRALSALSTTQPETVAEGIDSLENITYFHFNAHGGTVAAELMHDPDFRGLRSRLNQTWRNNLRAKRGKGELRNSQLGDEHTIIALGALRANWLGHAK